LLLYDSKGGPLYAVRGVLLNVFIWWTKIVYRRFARQVARDVADFEAVLEESGEIIHALESGAITTDALTELGYALVRLQTDRRRRTVFKSVGIAIQDWAVASLLAKNFLL
jgi:ornithine cyclodeaminase/alanine dehydrogenase-like protein (mu-crystallin family)